MTLVERLNQIIAEQKITKREFARRVGISENYLYVLTNNGRKNQIRIKPSQPHWLN